MQNDEISTEIRSLYINGEKPDMDMCRRLIRLYIAKRDFVFAIFDGLDEYNQAPKQRFELFELFKYLESLDCRMLLSSRQLLDDLRNKLGETQTLRIKAHPSDLTNYIKTRLREAGNRNKTLEQECTRMAAEVDGM